MVAAQQLTLFDLPDSPVGESQPAPVKVVDVHTIVRLLPAPQRQPAVRGNFVLPKTAPVIYLSATVEETRAGLLDPHVEMDILTDEVKNAFREPVEEEKPGFSQTALEAFQMLGAGNMFTKIRSIFALMEVAEDEIEKAMRKHREDPVIMARIWGSFMTCKPRYGDMSETVYRAHVREMLERVIRNDKQKLLNEATNAEAMWVMVHTSFATPLNNLGTSVYAELFKRCFPEKTQEIHLDLLERFEPYDGAAAEEVARIKHKYASERDPLKPRLPCKEMLCKILKVYRLPEHLALAASR